MAKRKADSTANIPTAETIKDAGLTPAMETLPARTGTSGPSATMLAMFAPSADLSAKLAAGKIKKLTLPPIIKPASVGPGTGFMGKITGIIPSPVATYKSMLLQMTHPVGGDFCWPANAVTLSALATYIGVDRTEIHLEDKKTQAKLIGVTLIVEGLGNTGPREGKRAINLYNIAAVLD